ncbi:MAG: M48 family metallopeptidase [Clostridia bacterium]|nr:M48 family metallopeptidase [Clostridia bacterium]
MIKFLFLGLLCLDLGYKILKFVLSSAQKKKSLPDNVSHIYDTEDYAKWRAYTAEHGRIRLFSMAASFLIDVILFGTNLYSAVYYAMPGGVYLKSILVVLLYTAVMTVISLPFEYISDLKIEEKYGFNKSTVKTFVSDEIKSFLVNLILSVGLLCIVIALYNAFGGWFVFGVYAVLALFIVVFSMLNMTFQKLFNKFTPLEDGELRDRLVEMFRRSGYQLEDIFVMDASRRTTKVNAFCTGLGKFKKIVLYDNLVNNYTPGEIVAVFAHELAHYKHKDTAKNTVYSLFMMGCITALIAAFILVPEISYAYGFEEVNVMFALQASMSSITAFVMTLIMAPQSVLGRRYEYRADAMAVEAGYGSDMISALTKLSKDNLSDLNPHPFIVAMEHSHPTISQRFTAIEKKMKECGR